MASKPISGMMVNGFMVMANTSEASNVMYGPFDFEKDAENWASNFGSRAIVLPLYAPVWNRG